MTSTLSHFTRVTPPPFFSITIFKNFIILIMYLYGIHTFSAFINILEVSGSLWALLGFHWMDVWTWILGYCFPPPCPLLASCSTQRWPPAHRNKPAEIINNKMVIEFLYIKTSLQNLFWAQWCLLLMHQNNKPTSNYMVTLCWSTSSQATVLS